MNALKLRPKRDWLVVLADKRRTTTSGGIFLPGYETGVEKVTEGSGTVIRTSNSGDKIKVLKEQGLVDGAKIVYRDFVKHANPIVDIDTEDKWSDGTRKHYFLMSVDDVLGVLAKGTEVGVFSGRPMVPAKEKKNGK